MPKNYVIVVVASDMYLVKVIKSIVQLKLAMTIDHNHKSLKFMLLRLVVFDVAKSMVEVVFLTKHFGYCGESKIIFHRNTKQAQVHLSFRFDHTNKFVDLFIWFNQRLIREFMKILTFSLTTA